MVEIDINRGSFGNNLSGIMGNYTRAMYNNSIIEVGYIVTPISSFNKKHSKWNVSIPQKGIQYNDVPLAIANGESYSNGTGVSPMPLREGQPVVIAHMGDTNTRPVILFTMPFPGNVAGLEKNGKCPTPEGENNSYFNPWNLATFTYDSDCKAQLTPYLQKSTSLKNPNSNSSAGCEQQGNCELSSDTGVLFTNSVKATISSTANRFEWNQGTRVSMSEQAYLEAAKNAERYIVDMYNSIPGTSFANGRVFKSGNHLGELEEFGIIDKEPWLNQRVRALNQKITTELEQSIEVSKEMLRWLFSNYMNYFRQVINDWGSFTLDLGLVQVGTSFELTNDLSIISDFTTGYPLLDDYLNYLVETEFSKYLTFNIAQLTGLDLSIFETSYPMPEHTMITNAIANTIQTEASFITRLVPGGRLTNSSWSSMSSSAINALESAFDIGDILPTEPTSPPAQGRSSPPSALPIIIDDDVTTSIDRLGAFLTNRGIPRAGLLVYKTREYRASRNVITMLELLTTVSSDVEQLTLITLLLEANPRADIRTLYTTVPASIVDLVAHPYPRQHLREDYDISFTLTPALITSNPSVSFNSYSFSSVVNSLVADDIEQMFVDAIRVKTGRTITNPDYTTMTQLITAVYD
jgi:hypothetical protein